MVTKEDNTGAYVVVVGPSNDSVAGRDNERHVVRLVVAVDVALLDESGEHQPLLHRARHDILACPAIIRKDKREKGGGDKF